MPNIQNAINSTLNDAAIGAQLTTAIISQDNVTKGNQLERANKEAAKVGQRLPTAGKDDPGIMQAGEDISESAAENEVSYTPGKGLIGEMKYNQALKARLRTARDLTAFGNAAWAIINHDTTPGAEITDKYRKTVSRYNQLAKEIFDDDGVLEAKI